MKAAAALLLTPAALLAGDIGRAVPAEPQPETILFVGRVEALHVRPDACRNTPDEPGVICVDLNSHYDVDMSVGAVASGGGLDDSFDMVLHDHNFFNRRTIRQPAVFRASVDREHHKYHLRGVGRVRGGSACIADARLAEFPPLSVPFWHQTLRRNQGDGTIASYPLTCFAADMD